MWEWLWYWGLGTSWEGLEETVSEGQGLEEKPSTYKLHTLRPSAPSGWNFLNSNWTQVCRTSPLLSLGCPGQSLILALGRPPLSQLCHTNVIFYV